MEQFEKTIGFVLAGVLLWLVLDRQEKDLGLLLTLAVCCMVGAAALQYLNPVVELCRQLSTLGNLREGILEILLKAAGLGFLTETAAVVCKDAGNGSLANAIHFFGSAGILWLSLPLFQSLLTLIQEILGVL